MSAATEEKAELVFELEGMTCASCVASVRKAIEAVPGVEEVEVSLPLHLARVRAPRPAEADIAAAVARAGYVARPRAPREEGKPLAEEAASAARALADVRAARRRFLVSLVFTLPLLGLAWSSLAGLRLPPWTAWAQGLLATGALAGGTSIFAAAARRARRLGASMDTLVALGTLAAWGASWHALGNGGPLHFAAAGMIVTLVLLGRYLEARAQDRTGAALRGLLDLVPRIAHRLREDGGSEDVPVGELRPGDRLRVLPGEAIPVDGTVLVGSSEVDEALVTGESVPVLRGPGDPVVGGTINGRSPLVVRAVAVGADTQLARIVRLVARAQGSKAEVERLADRVSAVFVPTILLIALATGLGGSLLARPGALLAAVSVLVVACPCALGLATPTAIVVAVGVAARRGILIRDARSIESLAAVNHVVFDKTGTLSEGRFAVQSVEAAQGVPADTILALAAAVERGSEHPLAASIVREAESRGLPALPASDVEAVPGGGVRGTVAGQTVRVGAARWLGEEGLAASAGEDAVPGATRVFVARGEQVLGELRLADALRPTAGAAVARLRELGVRTVLLTGDRRSVAEAVGAQLGVDEVLAEVRPEGKLAAVEELRASGARVAMVGDGINDAPALAAADVGIAMGQGTDVAKEAASLTLLRDEPLSVPEALELSRRTLRTVRQNLGWAFGYNLVAVPLAVLGCLHPVVAAAAMASSSVLVVSNSLRLRRWAPRAAPDTTRAAPRGAA